MSLIDRRHFFKLSSIPFLSLSTTNLFAQKISHYHNEDIFDKSVKLFGDGMFLSPEEHARLLKKLVEERKVRMDSYLKGGAVRELERKFAEILGKEDAVFFPTGTLANHLSLKLLAGKKKRIIVPEESHIFMDSADCCQTLSGLHLIPVAKNRATFTLEEVKEVLRRTDSMVFKKDVGAIMIESPVRRKQGEIFDYGELKKICNFARQNNIGTHLDGARLFIALAYTGIPPTEYASHFDTVYISLYKYFNAPFGAIVAGPRSFTAEMADLRKLFGSTINKGWIPSLFALYFLDGFLERFKKAVENSELFFNEISKTPYFEIEKIPNGTNLFKLILKNGTEPVKVSTKLRENDIHLSRPLRNEKGFSIGINETFNRMSPGIIAQHFIEAVKQ